MRSKAVKPILTRLTIEKAMIEVYHYIKYN